MTSATSSDKDQAQALVDHLHATEPSYTCRVLEDGSVACKFDLIFTRAIALGVTEYSFVRRFCFDDRKLADQRFLELKSQHDEPPGFIARRPEI